MDRGLRHNRPHKLSAIVAEASVVGGPLRLPPGTVPPLQELMVIV